MEPEVVIGILGVFVSGGAVGVGVTLLGQWAHRSLFWKPPRERSLADRDVELLRGEVADLTRVVLDLDQRLEFQEKLISGESPVSPKAVEPAPPGDGSPPPLQAG